MYLPSVPHPTDSFTEASKRSVKYSFQYTGLFTTQVSRHYSIFKSSPKILMQRNFIAFKVGSKSSGSLFDVSSI